MAKWKPPVGGLSQPRRDTADPKKLTIYRFFNNQHSIINSQFQSYPLRQSNHKRIAIPYSEHQINLFPAKKSYFSIKAGFLL